MIPNFTCEKPLLTPNNALHLQRWLPSHFLQEQHVRRKLNSS